MNEIRTQYKCKYTLVYELLKSQIHTSKETKLKQCVTESPQECEFEH